MKKILIPLLLFVYSFGYSQPAPFFYIDTICDNPPAYVQVPVQVMDFTDIASLSFFLDYDTNANNLVYPNTYEVNDALSIGFSVVNPTPGKIGFAWFALMPLTLADQDTVVSFWFIHYQDSCYLNFQDSSGQGSYSNGLIIPSTVSINQQPHDFMTSEGQTAVFDVVTNTQGAIFQWQYSLDSGINWFNIPDNPPFYGVNSSVLIIDSVLVSYDQYQFRAGFLNCNAASSDPAVLSVLPNSSLNGTLTYPNPFNTPLANVSISLAQGGVVKYTSTTDNAGYYLFANVLSGVYDLLYQSPYPWGGVNASDALKIAQHFSGMIQLTNLPLEAADINNNGIVNSLDALLALKRFVGMISTFQPNNDDWLYDATSVNIPYNTSMMLDIRGICTGDVDISNIP
ncbi:MAG: dockerin type I domain-containing protein [Bacteroidales bacterium]